MSKPIPFPPLFRSVARSLAIKHLNLVPMPALRPSPLSPDALPIEGSLVLPAAYGQAELRFAGDTHALGVMFSKRGQFPLVLHIPSHHLPLLWSLLRGPANGTHVDFKMALDHFTLSVFEDVLLFTLSVMQEDEERRESVFVNRADLERAWLVQESLLYQQIPFPGLS